MKYTMKTARRATGTTSIDHVTIKKVTIRLRTACHVCDENTNNDLQRFIDICKAFVIVNV